MAVLDNWMKPGALVPRGDHLQQAVDAIRTLSNQIGLIPSGEQLIYPTQGQLAVIVGKGPAGDDGSTGADDLNGCQYWINFQLIQGGQQDDPIVLSDDTSQGDMPGGNGQPTIVSATNGCEYVYGSLPNADGSRNINDKAIGSHYLNTDGTQVVQVWCWVDSGPQDNSSTHYIFFCPVVGFWANINASTGQDPMNPSNSPFIYDWTKQVESINTTTNIVTLTDTNPAVTGTYADKTGAYNSWENAASTMMTPVPVNTKVFIEVTYAYPADKTIAPVPVQRFMFPTVNTGCSP